jgi:type IV pilus assembly protein PilW
MSHIPQQKFQAGFTLIEIMIAAALLGIVLAAVTGLFISTNEVHTVQNKVVDIQQGIRGSLDVLGRDIRMAGLNPTGDAANAGFAAANATNLHILYDFDSDGTCERDRHYQFDAAQRRLEIQSNGGGGFFGLAENIDSMTFNYTLDNGTMTTAPADPGDIQIVTIQACGQISGSYSDTYDHTYCFNSTAYCRNIGL